MQKAISDNQTAIGVTAAAMAGAAALSYMVSSGEAVGSILDIHNQSHIVDGKPEHRASRLNNPPDYTACELPMPDVTTMWEALLKGVKTSNNGPCLGARTGPNREYEWITYQQMIDSCKNFGSGLVHRGLKPCNSTVVGIFATNRPEWPISDYGCLAFSMVTVPLYDTLGSQAVQYILNQCEMEVVVSDTLEKVKTLLSLKTEVPALKTIVMIETITDELRTLAQDTGVDLVAFEDIVSEGKQNPQELVPPKPDDLFSFIYTSGTTGDPKGVMTTHHGFLSMLKSLLLHISPAITLSSEDRVLSYLPLAHNYERTVHVGVFMNGCRIGYYSRDIKMLADDLAALKPTIFASVPRLLNRVYDGVTGQVKNSFIKSTLFKWAIASKTKEVEKRVYRRNSIWDKLIFNKIQERLGGHVRLLITGSAPLSTEVMTFLRCALGCVIIEGYGQTECGAAMTMAVPGDPVLGTVGPPLPACQIKLVDVPEMDYYAKDNIGEVCCKADFVFKGYYKQPEKTKEALDEDGWLHTGDVGAWQENGTLKIMDRKKNIFKLAQGEYIAPEKIESVYTGSTYVAQCFIEGDSLKTCVMGVMVPDEQYLGQLAAIKGLPTNMTDFCNSKEAKDFILKESIEQGRKAGLKGFEQVKDIRLEAELWTIENNLLTPTFKNKRPSLRQKYKDDIIRLYEENGL